MTFRKLHLELQSVESLLRQGGGFAMNSRLCTDCGRRLPATAKKCYPCYCSTLQDEYCTSQTPDSRILRGLKQVRIVAFAGTIPEIYRIGAC